MAYSEFNLQTVIDRFGLSVRQDTGHFSKAPPAPSVSPILAALLAEQVPLAVAINTEKARSEMIVVNVSPSFAASFPARSVCSLASNWTSRNRRA